MQTLKAHYKNGRLFFKTPPVVKSADVLVTFLEPDTIESQNIKIDVASLVNKSSKIDKWVGCLKGYSTDNIREDRIKYLEDKHK